MKKYYPHINPSTKAQSSIKRIAPSEKIANKLRNIDFVEFSFFFFKTFKRLKTQTTKKMTTDIIPNNITIEKLLSIGFGKIFHHCDRFFNFINIVKNHQ